MNETPERICEALAWLYGGEWAFDGAGLYTSTDGDWMQLDENHTPELHRDCWMRDCADELAHAIAVTAPWEWKKLEFLEETWRVQSPCIDTDAWFAPRENRWYAALNIDGLSVSANDEVFLTSREEAQAFARAAYLCWMRGRFAMKGGAV